MTSNSVFIFTPFIPPDSSSAALRGRQLNNIANDEFSIIMRYSQSTLLFPFPTNRDHKLIRLLKEFLCGLELFIKVAVSNCDYYIFSSPPFLISLLGATAACLKRKKYLFDIRDLYPQVYLAYGLVSEENIAYRFLINWTTYLYKRAHSVLTVTESLVSRIEQQSGIQAILARNGYDNDIYSSDRKFEQFTCIYHGNLGQFQEIKLIVEIARQLKDVNFIIAGSGLKSSLLEDSPDNLKYLGQVSRKEVLKLLSKSHLGLSFLVDSQVGQDSFPVKIYEYLGANLPVLSTPLGEVSNLLGKYEMGKGFDPKNVNAITDYINEIRTNSNQYSQILQNISNNCDQFKRDHVTSIIRNVIKR